VSDERRCPTGARPLTGSGHTTAYAYERLDAEKEGERTRDAGE
jgi:hypothetical protein